jgi:hypothetical protein
MTSKLVEPSARFLSQRRQQLWDLVVPKLFFLVSAVTFFHFESGACAQSNGDLSSSEKNPVLYPTQLAERAQVALRKSDYDGAIALFKQAISLNEGDSGANYDPSKLPSIDYDSLRHGQVQVENMLKDRPLMGTYLHSSDNLQIWAIFKYAEKVLKSPVNWDPGVLKNSKLEAEHEIPYDGLPGRIRIKDVTLESKAGDFDRNSKKRAFELLWSSAVFELHNVGYAKEFLDTSRKAANGDLDPDAFVKAIFLTELKASQVTRKWYVQIYLPHAKKYNLPSDSKIWYCDEWGSGESLFNQYTDKKSYPWEPYSSYFLQIKSSGSAFHLTGDK